MLSFLFVQVLSLCAFSQGQGQYLPFLTLGTTAGVTRQYLPVADDGASGSISIPGGFYFGRTSKTVVYVSTNGYFSFSYGSATSCCPSTFSSTSSPDYIVAPFWADIDTNLGGSIYYEVHTPSLGSYSNTLLDQVSTFISSQRSTQFIGNWMLVASWDQVPKYQGSSSDRCAEPAAVDNDHKKWWFTQWKTMVPIIALNFFPAFIGGSITNTFQGILITNGISSYTVFTYECGAIGWGGGATIGYKAEGSFYQNHALSGSSAASIGCVNSPASQWSNVVYQLNDDQVFCNSPCQHGGRCIAVNTCSCATGWTGQSCETAVCSSPCQHGGRCIGPNTCSCATGWTGQSCETAVCSSPCQHGGWCIGPNSCSCTSGWNGQFCETGTGEDTLGQRQLVIVLASIIGGVALIVFISFMVLLSCCCTSSCPMYRAYYGRATLRSSSRTRGAYVAVQNSSDPQELQLPPPPSPPPSYSETGETTQVLNA